MSFSEWSDLKHKKKKTSTFAEWSDEKYGVSKEEEESALAWREDEIAPVKGSDSWFQGGAFSDGYQFGDVSKTIVGTLQDINENITTAVFDATENLIDTTAYGVGAIGGLFDEDFKDDVGKFIAKEILTPTESGEAVATYANPIGWANLLVNGGETEENSVFGDKADGLVQSGAHLVGSYALQAVGVPAWLTMGVNAFGSEIESAFQQDATFTEAGISGGISAASEIIFEKISSGVKFKGATLDDGLQNWLKNNITNKVSRTVAKYAVDMVGEGTEEVLTEATSAVGRKLTYLDDKEWDEILSSEDMFDAFIGGAVISGIAGGGQIVNSAKTGRDYVTGLTDSEEKVIKKLHEDAIAEAETNGTKLTSRQKNELYDSIVEQMDKGQLNIDDIESVLGGETYKSYKDTVESENALKSELAELQSMEYGKMNDLQHTRLNELKGMNLDDTTKRDSLRSQLDKTLSPMLKNSRLMETYNERARKGQALEIDLSQYKGKQKEAVERAVKSGVLNNTRKSKELVNVLSKIEADKGIVFNYTDNAKLKETGFAIEGKTVNGFEQNGAVTLNVQSAKSWQSVVGHEITHVLEGTDAYGALRKALFKYAESKGELASRKATLTELYKGIKADIDGELTADLVGDYLFSDTDFIRSLTTDRNVFQKVYDEIKYLCKVATGKQLTEIEKVRREFDKVWKEFSTEGINEELNEATDAEIDDVNYSIAVEDKQTLDSLNEQVARGEYDAETNPNGGYYVTYKSMSYWGTDENGNAILRSPMAEYVDGELSNAYLIPKDKSKLNWYQATETIDENTGLPSGLMVGVRQEGKKSKKYLPATENQDLIAEDWSNLYFNLEKKVLKNGKWVKSPVPARYNPYEHSSNSMLNDQFKAAYLRDNLVTVKMYVPVSEDNGAYRAKFSKDPTGWSDWKSGDVATKINKQKDLQRKVYLSRYAAPVEIVSDSEVAQAYKEYIDGTDVAIPDNVVSPNLLKELKKAGVPITESGKVKTTNKGGVEYDKTSQSYSPVRYSISSWGESDYVTERQSAAKDMAKTLGVTEREATKYIDDVNSIAKIIADDRVRLAYEASPNRSAFVSNAEYGGSIDFSTICKKRRLFTGTFEAIQNALPNTALTAEEVLEIRQMMKDKGYEVSCGLCYVEGSRANMGQYTKQFIERYKATNPEYVPNMAEMNTATGQEQIRKEHPEVYEAYEYFMNHYGKLSPTDKAIFASQQKPKMYQLATEYKGEVLNNFGKKESSVAEKNKNGGLRLQSFSDFEIIHLIDSMQVIMDMSRVGLAGQAYTKVPDFAWALGDTGLKINLSLIAKDVDANGRLVLDEVEGMKESDAMALRERYSDNVGTIIVTFTDEQLKAAMADERIDYIIPYHRSQWKTSQYESMGLPENTKDYTMLQNESYIEPVYNKNGKKQRPSNYMPNTYWDFNKSGKENAETYLKMCAENNRKPKFSHLLVDNQDGSYSLQPDGSTDGYWKTLIDFKMYNNEGNGVPQNPVAPNFNMEEAQRMLSEYNGGHEKFPVAKDIVEEFVSKHPDNIAPTANAFHSLSNEGEQTAPVGNYNTPLQDLYLAPTQEDIAENATTTENVAENAADEAPMPTDADAPPEMEYYNTPDTTSIDDKALKNIGKTLQETLSLTAEETKAIQEIVQEYSTTEFPSKAELFDTIKKQFSERVWKERNTDLADIKRHLKETPLFISDDIKADITDWSDFRKGINGKIKLSKDAVGVDKYYDDLVKAFPNKFNYAIDPEFGDLENPKNQIRKIVAVANEKVLQEKSDTLDDSTIEQAVNIISDEVRGYKENLTREAAEATAKEAIDSIAPAKATQLTDGTRGDALLLESLDNHPVQTVEQKVAEKIRAVEASLADTKQLRREAEVEYNRQIERLETEYANLKNKSTKKANNILNRVIRLQRLKADVDAEYSKRISDLEARTEKMRNPKYSRAMQKQAKMQEHADWAENLLGDTSTWVDKKLGLQYATNTERRNLRDIVRDENGNKDIAKADAIDDALNGRYNREEAAKKRELSQVREKYADEHITKAEDAYIQMLGELRHNPETTLTEKVVNEYYEKHKNKIDTEKVERIIDLARQDYDNFIKRVNEELRKQGMAEIPYRQGYFPHFTEPKQNFIQKLLNWKTQDNEIPTSIAGLTETFRPVKSWQSFDKQRHSDTTDFSFTKGFDNYSQGVLDWIYHLDTLQKRRAVENHIRFTHSDEGIKAKIKEVYANEEIDANEAQAQIEHILSEANNPLNNFIQDFTTHTNILAGKKNSLDRTVEQWTNRHIYSVMTNVQNRMSANMVLANVRSALTNFIPITQSWAQVSPMRSLQAAKDTIANAIKDDGMVEKSTFLTNRLKEPDNLYNTAWDKVLDKAGIMFEIVDSFSSQVIWRSKYSQNIANGMTESQAIENADQFAESVMAGRSKGNEPTLFNAKNPFVKAFTMFQLEVNNQYGYFFKDVPNDLKAETNHWKLNLAKGYTTAFIGAYVYNALMEQISGSGAALDPIGIIEDLLRDLGLFDDDEKEEPAEVVTNLVDNVVEELPFVGGFFGGGRVPISSALPYSDDGITGAIEDISEGNWGNVGKEMMNPFLNIVLPVGGGQIKKTVQGLGMFSDEHPVTGSYTDSGNLRFPVEDTLGNRIQAGIFGQYASENAREYFDNGYAPLKEKQIQEYIDVELPIADYWKYREGLKGLEKNAEKADYINSLNIEDWQKNLLMNNILDRKEDVDMSNYDDYSDWEEFDYAQKNPEKYALAKSVGGYYAYKWYSNTLNDITADKDENGKTISGSRKEKVLEYINALEADYETKLILYKSEYPSDDTFNWEIVNYINNRDDLTYEERISIFTKLGFTVSDGNVSWD